MGLCPGFLQEPPTSFYCLRSSGAPQTAQMSPPRPLEARVQTTSFSLSPDIAHSDAPAVGAKDAQARPGALVERDAGHAVTEGTPAESRSCRGRRGSKGHKDTSGGISGAGEAHHVLSDLYP